MDRKKFIKNVAVGGKSYGVYDINQLAGEGTAHVGSLPFSIKILVENLLRKLDGRVVREEDLLNIANWQKRYDAPVEIPYHPARVLMQDFTGVPAVVDLAAMRDAMKNMGGDPKKINPLVPVDLVIDHSVQVDYYGTDDCPRLNVAKEYERNGERYTFLKWAQKSFDNFSVVPPRSGICHQVNLEYLGKTIIAVESDGLTIAYPDTVVGLDSHTTMGFFPVDEKTVNYLEMTNRAEQARIVEACTREMGLFYTGDTDPEYTDVLELDLATVKPAISGPARPHDRIELQETKETFAHIIGCEYERDTDMSNYSTFFDESGCETRWAHRCVPVNQRLFDLELNGSLVKIGDGSIVIAAITSCTNTSNFLASPMLVVAFALAGRIDTDLYMEPVGIDPNGEPVYMNEIWPDHAEIAELVSAHVRKEFYQEEYGRIFEGDEFWQGLDVAESTTYAWDETSTYIKNPPYFENFSKDAGVPPDIAGAQTLLVLGDTVTTDHISPAGAIPAEYPAVCPQKASWIMRLSLWPSVVGSTSVPG